MALWEKITNEKGDKTYIIKAGMGTWVFDDLTASPITEDTLRCWHSEPISFGAGKLKELVVQFVATDNSLIILRDTLRPKAEYILRLKEPVAPKKEDVCGSGHCCSTGATVPTGPLWGPVPPPQRNETPKEDKQTVLPKEEDKQADLPKEEPKLSVEAIKVEPLPPSRDITFTVDVNMWGMKFSGSCTKQF